MINALRKIPAVHRSQYAGELRRGAREMRFSSDLEREYHRFYLAERRSHLRSFNVLILVMIVLGSGYALWARAVRADLTDSLELAAISLAYLPMVWAAYSRHYERVYLRTAHYASVVVSLVAANYIARCVHSGAGELFGLLMTYSIVLYFLAGLLYRAALQANIALLVAFCGTLAYLGEPRARVVELTAILAVTAAIGGIAKRQLGGRFRRTYLECGRVAEMAVHDHLTGLGNRRVFDEQLKRIWQQALRDRRQLVVMMCDVDHFKRFNDRYGHQAGDAALKRIAGVIESYARRPLDLAARYGGEELAVILFDVSRECATTIAENVRKAVEGLHIPHATITPGVVTVSIGVAIVRPTLERNPDGAVQLADEALYQAKRAGRNTVRVFETEYEGLSTGTFRAH